MRKVKQTIFLAIAAIALIGLVIAWQNLFIEMFPTSLVVQVIVVIFGVVFYVKGIDLIFAAIREI